MTALTLRLLVNCGNCGNSAYAGGGELTSAVVELPVRTEGEVSAIDQAGMELAQSAVMGDKSNHAEKRIHASTRSGAAASTVPEHAAAAFFHCRA